MRPSTAGFGQKCQPDAGVSCKVPEGQVRLRGVKGNQSEIVLADAGESSLVAARDFVREIIKSLVFLDRPAKCRPACTRV